MSLIIDMEMPKCCGECACCDSEYRYCAARRKPLDELNERPSWCPIKGELPDEHGDLIDTSTVVGSIKRETDIHDVTLKEYLGFKFPVQTIVPIDEFLENRKTIPIIVAAERKDDGNI